jgi:HemY protein
MIAPKHPVVLKLLERIYIHAGDWENVLKISPDLYKAGVVTRSQYPLLQKRIYIELLKNSRNPSEVWKTIPKKFLSDPEILFYYVRSIPPSVESEEMIFKALKKSWNKDLVELYGHLVFPDLKKQLSHAEALLKYYPREPILFCALGQLAARAKLWGKARNYFMESLKLDPAPKTYAAYAKLLQELGDQAGALDNYREASPHFRER